MRIRSKSCAEVVPNKSANETDVSWTKDAQDWVCDMIGVTSFQQSLKEHGGVRGEALFSLKDYVFKT